MGWWHAGEDGSSLHIEETGLSWGDGPADIMDDAIDSIVSEFREAWGRKPTKAELVAGLRFSLGGYDEESGDKNRSGRGSLRGQLQDNGSDLFPDGDG